MKISNLALTLGATIRLTRFVVADQLGEWLIHEPIDLFRANYFLKETDGMVTDEGDGDPHTEYLSILGKWNSGDSGPWWWRYREGLDCPWCVGYWVGAGVLAGSVLTEGTRAEKPWRFVLGTLALNTVANSIAGLPSLDLYGQNGDEHGADHDED